MSCEVIRSANFVRGATDFILGVADEALRERGEFRIALSGGNTPRPIYREVARQGRSLAWNKTLITFGDERCVPPDDEQSNYRMARESLLSHIDIPDSGVLRMRGELEPEAAASEYERQLDSLAKERSEEIYRHDLILLGIGEDGHTASLFPETKALTEKSRSVVANFVPKMETWRLTFTLPLINQARRVCFLANASKHAELIESVLKGDTQYPAARVQPASGALTWILGQAA
jgi:6-phosphogluconolactonase